MTMKNAQEIVRELADDFDSLNFDDESKQMILWILKSLWQGISPMAELNPDQEGQLCRTINDTMYHPDMHDVHHSIVLARRHAREIAVWVNGAHVANRCT